MPLFKLDFGLMEQVLHNLISNAVQHNEEGTDIVIKADCLNDKLLIEISDYTIFRWQWRNNLP